MRLPARLIVTAFAVRRRRLQRLGRIRGHPQLPPGPTPVVPSPSPDAAPQTYWLRAMTTQALPPVNVFAMQPHVRDHRRRPRRHPGSRSRDLPRTSHAEPPGPPDHGSRARCDPGRGEGAGPARGHHGLHGGSDARRRHQRPDRAHGGWPDRHPHRQPERAHGVRDHAVHAARGLGRRVRGVLAPPGRPSVLDPRRARPRGRVRGPRLRHPRRPRPGAGPEPARRPRWTGRSSSRSPCSAARSATARTAVAP